MDNIVWAAFITALGGLLLGIYTTWTTRKKPDAEANAITSTEWKRLYDEMCETIIELRAEIKQQDEYFNKQLGTMREAERIMINRIRDLESKLESTMRNLDVAEDNIKFLLKYISNAGIDVPDLRFRG